MKRMLLYILLSFFPWVSYADDLDVFQSYAAQSSAAYLEGNMALCIKNETEIVRLFDAHRRRYLKNDDICRQAFESYTFLAFYDKSKRPEEVTALYAKAFSLIDDHSRWIKAYTNKNHIVQLHINFIGHLLNQKDTLMASKYNEKMIDFAEQHYRFELASVLFSACAMNSLMLQFEKNYPLYLRLYEMFGDLDKHQQYRVVRELIRSHLNHEKYDKVIELALRHEKLIRKSRDEVKEDVLCLIGWGFLDHAKSLAEKQDKSYTDSVDRAYAESCAWSMRNHPLMYPTLCIQYAYWLYQFDSQKSRALVLYEHYLEAVEHSLRRPLFDQQYHVIEDAENALISIFIQKIIRAAQPADLNHIIDKYPQVVLSILNAPDSQFYEDFTQVLQLAKKVCYGQ